MITVIKLDNKIKNVISRYVWEIQWTQPIRGSVLIKFFTENQPICGFFFNMPVQEHQLFSLVMTGCMAIFNVKADNGYGSTKMVTAVRKSGVMVQRNHGALCVWGFKDTFYVFYTL